MSAWKKVVPEPASWSHLRRSPGSITQIGNRSALALRAHTHRVMTAHPVEVAASARRNRKGTPSGSSFRLPLAMTGHFGGFGAGLRQVMAS
jgi:hypothetical protein